MLIQLPILFALYQVIYAVPAYVNSLNDLYMQIAEPISRVSNGGEIVTGLINDLGVRVTSFDFSNMNKIVDFLYNLRFTDFPAVSDAFSAAPEGPVILPVIGALPLPNRLKPAKLKASESTVVPPTLPTFRHTRTPMPRFLI